jgi:hypothetical protein
MILGYELLTEEFSKAKIKSKVSCKADQKISRINKKV